MKLRMRVTGGAEIQRKLELMPKELNASIMQDVVLMGGEIIKEEAKRNANRRKRTGTLADSIEVKLGKENVGTKVVAVISAGSKGWYGKLLELGHRVVVKGVVVGQVPPYPWLRPAFDAKKKEAREVMNKELERRLAEIWQR